jgi:FkbM family methyltransferase
MQSTEGGKLQGLLKRAVKWATRRGRAAVIGPDLVRERYIQRQGFIITDLITKLLPPDERFVILDGGARDALADPRWQAFEPGRARLYGFEPDDKETISLNAEVREKGLDFHYFSGALWSEPTELTFYENKASGGGSFYPQNTALTERWKFENTAELFLARDIFYPTGTAKWKMTSVDAWAAAQEGRIDIDFLKLNVQGAELEILKGASSIIDSAIGLMVEVSFVESYKERPFFADIDKWLRDHDFTFFDLIGHHYMGRANSPITARHLPGLYGLYGQLIEGHGIYLRDPIDMQRKGLEIGRFSKNKLLKLAAFSELFGQAEYAFELLLWVASELEMRGDAESAAQVRKVAAEAEQSYLKYMR